MIILPSKISKNSKKNVFPTTTYLERSRSLAVVVLIAWPATKSLDGTSWNLKYASKITMGNNPMINALNSFKYCRQLILEIVIRTYAIKTDNTNNNPSFFVQAPRPAIVPARIR